MKYLATLLLAVTVFCAAALWSQDANPVNISPAPVARAYTTITHYNTNKLPDYVCKALSSQNVSTITVSAISNANPGVMTATAHGFYYQSGLTFQQQFVAFISGLSGNWTPLNGIQVLTPSSANALTTTVNTTGFGALTGTPLVSTRAPTATASVWSLQVTAYDANNNPTLTMWPVPTSGTSLGSLAGGQTSFNFPCTLPSAFQ
jgi:hypothetical protein